MRLLNLETFQLEEFFDSNIPPYWILSHRWGGDEISYQDMTTLPRSELEKREAWPKLAGFCEACRRLSLWEMDGVPLIYIWVDTFCIDKTSSAELSEAINSMFRWYSNARLCIAYLDDVPGDTEPWRLGGYADKAAPLTQKCQAGFTESKWFTRGWTLQELLAPKKMIFFSKSWTLLGYRDTLAPLISATTGIDISIIGTGKWSRTTVATRMKWAAKRETTRSEDLAYCLLGIFDINMPLLYGEGEKAFFRLQEEILKEYDDDSIFLWAYDGQDHGQDDDDATRSLGVLALRPSWFADAPQHQLLAGNGRPTMMTNQGIQIERPIIDSKGDWDSRSSLSKAVLLCCPTGSCASRLAIPLVRFDASSELYSRPLGGPVSVPSDHGGRKRQVLLSKRGIDRPSGESFVSMQVELPKGYSRDHERLEFYPRTMEKMADVGKDDTTITLLSSPPVDAMILRLIGFNCDVFLALRAPSDVGIICGQDAITRATGSLSRLFPNSLDVPQDMNQRVAKFMGETMTLWAPDGPSTFAAGRGHCYSVKLRTELLRDHYAGICVIDQVKESIEGPRLLSQISSLGRRLGNR